VWQPCIRRISRYRLIGSGLGTDVGGLQWVVDGYRGRGAAGRRGRARAAGRAGTHSGYADLLPAFLLWGIGCGLLTPAVVEAAIATVPAERSGLASAVNNTARQTGGVIGIAVAGAVVGQASDQTRCRARSHRPSGAHEIRAAP
jgi:MFS family permease